MHASASQYLLPWIHADAHILDVGSGSGYTVAVFHRLIQAASANGSVSSPGQVVGIDHIRTLVEWSVENLHKDGLGEALEKEEIVMVTGDGRKGECRLYAVLWLTKNRVGTRCALPRYPRRRGGTRNSPSADRYAQSARKACTCFLLVLLHAEARCSSRMFIPVGPDGGNQDVWTVDKDADGNIKQTRLFGVRVRAFYLPFCSSHLWLQYVPLTDEATQTGSRY